jgi:hypothetical protein
MTMQPQTRVRRMRSPKHPRRHGRTADGTRQNYYAPDVIPSPAAPELILVTDDDGNLTGAYIAYLSKGEDTP